MLCNQSNYTDIIPRSLGPANLPSTNVKPFQYFLCFLLYGLQRFKMDRLVAMVCTVCKQTSCADVPILVCQMCLED